MAKTGYLEQGLVDGRPVVLLHGADDGATLAAGSDGLDSRFAAGYRREVLPGIGHSVQLEQPDAVIAALHEQGVG